MKQSPRTCCALPRSPRGYTSRLSRGRRPLSHFTLSCKKKKVVSLAVGGEVEERHDTRSISSILLFLLLPASSPRRSHFFQHPVLEIICCCCFVLFFYIIVLFSPRCCSDETLFPDVEVASCFVQRPLCTQLSAVEIEQMQRLRKGKEKKTRCGSSSWASPLQAVAVKFVCFLCSKVYTALLGIFFFSVTSCIGGATVRIEK